MRCAVVVVALWPGLAAAWEAMPVGDLVGLDIRFGSGLQHFYASGRTFHTPREDDPFANGPSWGYWREEEGRYCAQWPPDARWICYEVARTGPTVRFAADDGGVVVGTVLGTEPGAELGAVPGAEPGEIERP